MILLDVIKYAYENKTTVSFGRYKEEPIEWEVKDIIDNKALLVTKDIIECKPFDSTKRVRKYGNPCWRDSQIRQWLNNDFYNNVFNEIEKLYIFPYTHTEKWHTKKGLILKKEVIKVENVTDKVFLLSKEEIEKYYKTSGKRIKQGTKHSIENNLYVAPNGNSCFWLRTSTEFFYVYDVHSDGSIDLYYPNLADYGIVCALLVDIS